MTKYRPEIDGLRAVAILPVVLYHASIPGFTGGYVGVDVFFVISGYLISTIILEQLRCGTFSFIAFYKRRMKRIFPALFVMLAASFGAAFLLLPPSEMQQFAQSVIASTFFYSNHFFLGESGYFATAAELTPLLHTWSLSVEEQFYLIFPAILLATNRFSVKYQFAAITLLAALSFGAAQYLVHSDPSAAFYLLPTRFWELALGAMAAQLQLAGVSTRGRFAGQRTVLALLGAALILYAVFAFDKDTPFPGAAALLPSVGAVLIIMFAGPADLVGRLLAQRGPVFIGLISYSLYLWHYPMLAFARRFPGGENPLLLAAVAAAAVLVAYLSYRLVETPIRRNATLSTRQVYSASFAAMAGLAVLGFSAAKTDGYRAFYIQYRLDAATRSNFERYSPMATRGERMEVAGDDGSCVFRAQTVDDAFISRFDACAARYGKAAVLIGDSHAINIHNALATDGTGPFFVSIAQGGCRPQKDRERCGYKALIPFAAERTGSISRIILHIAGSHLILDEHENDGQDDAFEPGHAWMIYDGAIKATGQYLGRLPADIPVVWLGPFAEARVDLKEPTNYSPEKLRFSEVSIAIFTALDARLKADASAQQRYTYISLVDGLGFGPGSLLEEGCLTFQDVDHFSACGEKRFGPMVARLLALK